MSFYFFPYFCKHNRPYKYCLNLKFVKAQSYYNEIRIISSNYMLWGNVIMQWFWGKKWMQHNSSLPLIFLILGFILNQGRRSNSYQLFLHSSANNAFLVQSYGSRKGRRQRNEHVCYIFSQCACEVVILSTISQFRNLTPQVLSDAQSIIYFCLPYTRLVQSICQGGGRWQWKAPGKAKFSIAWYCHGTEHGTSVEHGTESFTHGRVILSLQGTQDWNENGSFKRSGFYLILKGNCWTIGALTLDLAVFWRWINRGKE